MTDPADTPTSHFPDARGGERWRMLTVIATAELLGMSLWFTASATAAHYQAALQLSPGQTGGLTTAVQIGFVAGTALAALLNVADVLPARLLFTMSVLGAACANALLVNAHTLAAVLALRFTTGLLLAGVYPPAMKMAATWFSTRRGLAIGVVVGALTAGKAAPYLIQGLRGDVAPSFVILSASLGAAAAGLLVFTVYRDGPFAFPHRPFSWRLVGVVCGDRRTRLAIGGYLGHMWELYACWAALAAFFMSSLALRSPFLADLSATASLAAFAAISAGSVGSVAAGVWADRWGRENVAIGAMAVSAACALSLGWLVNAPIPLVLAIALLWGFAVVADSAQFSALVTEAAPAHAVGTALTLQTSLGFALTALSIWLSIEIAARAGWGYAFTLLAAGPLLGIVAMLRLKRLRGKQAQPMVG